MTPGGRLTTSIPEPHDAAESGLRTSRTDSFCGNTLNLTAQRHAAWRRGCLDSARAVTGLRAGPAFGLVEGWRGKVIHWVMVNAQGALERVKVLDPAFFNWHALSYALLKNIVPDVPLCNKSFNQSYSGNDL